MRTTALCIAAVFTALLAAACSSQQQSGGRAAHTPAAIVNPLDFPLPAGSKVLSVRSFTQVVNTAGGSETSSIFAAGNGKYAGHEVIAAVPASFSQLSAWVSHLDTTPPHGYSLTGADLSTAHEQARQYGIDYAVFRRTVSGRPQGTLVIVMDPALVDKRFGTILGLIGKYKSLPPMLRAPIDNEVKTRTGMTVSEAMQPDSPIGAALSGLDQFGKRQTRGIVVLQAAKQ